jgi:hypothetical protein
MRNTARKRPNGVASLPCHRAASGEVDGGNYGRTWYDTHVNAPRTRVWGIGKFLLLVGALGLTFLIFFGLAMRWRFARVRSRCRRWPARP